MSSLVVCSMLAYTFASISLDQFPWENSADATDEANFVNPNEELIAEQQTAVARDPNNIEEMLLLANLLGNSGRLTEAVPWYERVLQSRPQDVAARVDFARALADGGMTADAELQFLTAIEIDPRNQEAHFYLAELYNAWTPRRIAEAAREYGEAKAIDPTTFQGQQADEALRQLGVGQLASSPSPIATPEVISTP